MFRHVTTRFGSDSFIKRTLCLAFLIAFLLLPEINITWNAQATNSQFSFTPSMQQQTPRNAGVQKAQEADVLEPGKPVERALAAGQNHAYQITLAEGQFLSVIVEQRGIDVVVRLLGPDGKEILGVNSEIRKQGQETVWHVAEVAGSYRLKIQAARKDDPAGRYEIRVAELRAATEKDRVLSKAHRLNTQLRELRSVRNYGEAIRVAKQILEIRSRELGEEHPDVAYSLNSLANLYYDKGDYATAEPLYQRALAIREKMLDLEHPDVARSLNNLALIYRKNGDFAKAESYHRRALAIREKTLGPDHPDVIVSLSNLALIYRDKGDYAEAEQLYQRALAIREKVLGPEHPDVASSLSGLAGVYYLKLDYAKAEQLYQRALAIREKVLGPEHPDIAGSLYGLALIYRNIGDYAKAEQLGVRSLAIREKTLGPEHPEVAASLNNLAVVYRDKGDYGKAEPLYQRALIIQEKTLGPEHPHVAYPLNNLALISRYKGDYAKAEQLYQRALAIREKSLGSGHPDVALSLNGLAGVYYLKGDYAKAEQFYQRALTIREKTLEPWHPDVARSLDGLAITYQSKGDYAKAEQLYQRTLAIEEKTLGHEHPRVARTLNNLSTLYTAKGDISQAVAFHSRAMKISEQNIALNLNAGSDRQKLAYLVSVKFQTNWSISLHVHAAPDDLTARNLAAITILQRKGRALDAMSDSLNALRQRLKAEDQSLLDQLTDTTARLTQLIFDRPAGMSSEQYQGLISTLEEKTEKLQGEISRRSVEFQPRSQPVTLEAVQSAISADAALIEFASYRPYVNEAYGKPRYVAYVLRRQGEVQYQELGEARIIDEAINKLREALRDPARKDVKELSRDVSEKVMQPVLPLLGGARQLLISPDGVLNLIPFEALVDDRGQYLIGSYSFTYLTSGRDLLRLQVARESKSNPLVIAGPEYGRPPGREMASVDRARLKQTGRSSARMRSVVTAKSFSDLVFETLYNAEEEANDLKKILPEATTLTKEQATETALKQAAAPRILHVATHGFFLEDRPVRAEDAGSLDGEGDSEGLGANVKIENPLLRSGLAMAGANLRRSGDDDGILTALEVSGLNLWGTKLVALSACDTGVGVVRTGEGVYGLRRALVLAGSETQVMSLWPVSDYMTRKLMRAYYTRLKRGEGRGEALRQVKLEILRQPGAQHPFYWASFIQSGEWANLDGKR